MQSDDNLVTVKILADVPMFTHADMVYAPLYKGRIVKVLPDVAARLADEGVAEVVNLPKLRRNEFGDIQVRFIAKIAERYSGALRKTIPGYEIDQTDWFEPLVVASLMAEGVAVPVTAEPGEGN